jgi:hypothetical protein
LNIVNRLLLEVLVGSSSSSGERERERENEKRSEVLNKETKNNSRDEIQISNYEFNYVK